MIASFTLHKVWNIAALLVFTTNFWTISSDTLLSIDHPLDYRYSSPKLTLGNDSLGTISIVDVEPGTYTTMELKIVLICESSVPTRWLLTPEDWMSRRTSFHVDKGQIDISGNTVFLSTLTIELWDIATHLPNDKDNYTAKVNVSCVNSIQNSSLDPVTCVQVTHVGSRRRPGPVTLNFDKNACLGNCVAFAGLNPSQNCDTIGMPGEDRFACVPGNYDNGTFGFCVEMGFCKYEDIGNVYTEGCRNFEERMTDLYNRGYAWHLLGSSKKDYSKITKDFPQMPASILFFPGNLKKDDSYGRSGNRSFGTDLNMLERITHDSIEIFAMDWGNMTLLDGGNGRHEFEENETVEFACRTVWMLRNFQFLIGTTNGSFVLVTGSGNKKRDDVQVLEVKTKHLHIIRTNITLSAGVYGQTFWVSCMGTAMLDSRLGFRASMKASIYPEGSPYANLTVYEMDGEDLLMFNCSYGGRPRPNLTWIVSDQVEFVLEPSDESHNGRWSQVRGISISSSKLDTLNVTCEVRNPHGRNQSTLNMKDFFVHVPRISLIEAIGLFSVGSILILTMLTTCLYFRHKQRTIANQKQDREDEISMAETILQEESPPHSSKVEAVGSPNRICTQDQSKYELLPDEFTIDKRVESRLGSGEFGQVYRGKVSKRGEEKERQVAVKMPVDPVTETSVKGMQDELTYLSCLAKHPYIVELIGVYTAELDRNILFVFLELCELGSLLNYLKDYELVEEVVMMGREEGSSYHNIPMTVLSIDKNFAIDMCRWTREIASGMEHIISKGLLHRDLATRNILLTGDKRVKITDFGLTRPMNDSQIYIKRTNNPLPWKWMAPECLPLPGRTQFTEKSEVWSFGITLWEIYCLGEEPYSGVVCSEEFANWLNHSQNRLSEPRYCRNNMYSVMHRCWAREPEDRPTFSELIRILRENSTEND